MAPANSSHPSRLADDDVHALGRALDDGLRTLAPGDVSQDELKIAAVTGCEYVFHTWGREAADQQAMLAPILDQIIPLGGNVAPSTRASARALSYVQRWLPVAMKYHQLVEAIINHLQGRMAASRWPTGRVVFEPSAPSSQAYRSRWMYMQWRRNRAQAGRLVHLNDELPAMVPRLDGGIELRLLETDTYRPPNEPWYMDHISRMTDSFLSAQFRHVEDGEIWAGLSKHQQIEFVRPLFEDAARILFAHSRAYVGMGYWGMDRPLQSAVGWINIREYAQQACHRLTIDLSHAESLVQSLLRTRRGERAQASTAPLIPMNGARAIFAPSVVLFSNWPLAREWHAARTGNQVATGLAKHRNARNTARVVAALRKQGFGCIKTEVDILGQGGTVLTDLDVVALSDGSGAILILQLKSFVTPTNLLDHGKATADVADAVRQCSVADTNVNAVRRALLGFTDVSASFMPEQLTLRHIIVVEHNGGDQMTPQAYPVVTIDWLESYCAAHAGRPSVEDTWCAAVELPDAKHFFDTIQPFYRLYPRDSVPGLASPVAIADFLHANDKALASSDG